MVESVNKDHTPSAQVSRYLLQATGVSYPTLAQSSLSVNSVHRALALFGGRPPSRSIRTLRHGVKVLLLAITMAGHVSFGYTLSTPLRRLTRNPFRPALPFLLFGHPAPLF